MTRLRKSGISIVVVALLVLGFFGAKYFFSVPEVCDCRASALPRTLSDASILENSIGDSNTIIIQAGGDTEHIRICYSHPPKHGNIEDPGPGLDLEGCKYQNVYNLEEVSGWRTDVEASIEYKVTERFISTFPEIPGSKENLPHDKDKSTKAGLYLNRSNNTCMITFSEWSGTRLPGQMECRNPVFYFKPWSWFPQTSELFYTRVFFAIHKQRDAK